MLKQIIKLKSKYSNFILIFLALSIAFSLVYYKEIDAQNIKNEKIDLCCTWGSELKDNVLTYKIEKGTKDHEKITASAFSEWENSLNNIHFKNVKDNDPADIEIKFKKGNVNQGGQAEIYFDQNRFIDYVKISVSKTSNGTELNKTMLEHIIKHEIGHALGLGHSQFSNSLMYPIVNEAVMKISRCEIDAVKDANNWKFIKNEKKPKMLEQSVYICT
ncbi:MAG TPA: M57 family metalloprotease [Nitrososphaeraceae archaeon]|nr:M57 family metalloprotease [Nitrososphaeraceae archaeon]